MGPRNRWGLGKLPVKPATQTNAIEQPCPQICWFSTDPLKIGVSQQPLASPAHFSDRGPAERSFSFLSRIAGRYRGWIAAHWMSL